VDQLIKNIQLLEETCQEAFKIVENLFEVFTELTDELLVYAKKHSFEPPFAKPRDIWQPLKATQLARCKVLYFENQTNLRIRPNSLLSKETHHLII
jgi:hypothetical protein